jgi:hypothetical integral membrane protein (TIGR02206 family)
MDWTRFAPLGHDHLAALGLLGLLGGGVVVLGRRAGPRSRRVLARLLALDLVAYAAVAYFRQWRAGDLDWATSLPLELCHWVMLAALVALVRGTPLATEVAYFWGLAGTLPAMLTPDLGAGFPSWDFIQFFWGHGAVLLGVAYLAGAERLAPRPRSPARMLALLNVYALAVGAVDQVAGWNYGYLCRKPAAPSLLDYLGPWPWYLASLELVAAASFLLLDLPWRVRRGARLRAARSRLDA